MIKEVFTDIPDYEGLYQLSNLDRVSSLKFESTTILKENIDNRGYINYCLWKGGKSKTLRLHVLKMMVYKGFEPCGHKLVVDHIDNDKANNDLSNLQIITHRKNLTKDKKSTSNYAGVSWNKQCKRWVSQIRINSVVTYLGVYTDEYPAHLAYEKALKEIA